MIKAIFFDIDGTLVSFKTHRMSDRLKESLRSLQKNGVKLFISSGRTTLTMDNLDSFPFDGYIAMNGAVTILNGEVIDSHPIPKETAIQIARIASREKTPCWIFTEKLAGVNLMNSRSEEFAKQINCFPKHFYDIEKVASEQDVYEYTFFFSEEDEKKFLRPVLKGVTYPRWHPYFTDIVPEGLAKSYGASKILARLGVTPEECLSFGDGGNDVPLFEYVGTGVAMGNAPDDVKAKADYVTDSVDEDGVVTALAHFGLLNPETLKIS